MKYLILILVLTCSLSLNAQDHFRDSLIRSRGFRVCRLISKHDTIHFYVYHKGTNRPKSLVLFLSGSAPQPLFSYEYDAGKLKSYVWGHPDYKLLDSSYAFVTIAKPGLAGMFSETELKDMPTPQQYLDKNSLDYRVWQADQVINWCCSQVIGKGGKVIVYGHSEGYNVAARLLTVNKKITHAGLWCGSAMPDYQDFMQFKRKEVLQGKISDSLAAAQLDTMLNNYKAIFSHPDYHQPGSVYTNKRWISYAQGPIEDLKKVKIPIYVIACTKDDSAPFENAYIVPLEFTRLGKTNLSWNVCVGCEHSLNVIKPNGDKLSYWSDYFRQFITWTDSH